MTSQKSWIYIFIRTDIPLSQQIVQASHAAVESGVLFYKKHLRYPSPASIVLLQVESEKELLKARHVADGAGILNYTFCEPEAYDPTKPGQPLGFTSVCTEPVKDKQRSTFIAYSLWTVPEVYALT
jgi:hypothetical protein